MKPLFAAGLALVLCTAQSPPPAWQPAFGYRQIPIWSGAVPDARPNLGPETFGIETKQLVSGRPWTYINAVSRPTMTVYSPRVGNTGVAVVVFPGGGYQVLAIDLEGTEVCDWLTSRGITCVLLKYRVPGEGRLPKSGPYPDSPEALEDAQRTLGLVRSRAAQWHIDPYKIGVLGFSAGGHLVAATSVHFNKRIYRSVDAADNVSCRPDFAIAIYPGHLATFRDSFDLKPDIGDRITSRTPPTFLVQNEDDHVDGVEQSLSYYATLEKKHVLVEMHLFAQGGHAFGLRRTKFPVSAWPRLVETWLHTIGMLH